MPKSKPKKPVVPVTPEPPLAPSPEVAPPPFRPPKPVVYDRLEIVEYSTTSAAGPIYVENMKTVLGWETEAEFKVRKVAEFPDTKPESWSFGDDYHCRDITGQKVRCNNNAHNRPFDMDWCESLIHTILCGRWAGPHTIPGGTVNGETIRISCYGEVLSAQHQGTALILAGQILRRDRELGVDTPENPKYPVWVGHDEPFLETIVVRGMSDDPRILMTVDYVKPRTAADVFYTSEVFRGSASVERKELCRMIAIAVDLMWTRTDARGYRTHPEVVGFLERHKRLLKCVEHVFRQNSEDTGRRIAKMHLSPGKCVAVMYLQAASGLKTDGNAYRNEEPAPSEARLDWSLWDRTEEFWSLLVGSKDFGVVRAAFASLLTSDPASEDNQGLGGRNSEKLALLAKAWDRWRDHKGRGAPFGLEDVEPGGDLCLSYSDLDDRGNSLPDGEVKLIDVADFGGIDCPDAAGKKVRTGPPDPPPPSPEEMRRMYEERDDRRRVQNQPGAAARSG